MLRGLHGAGSRAKMVVKSYKSNQELETSDALLGQPLRRRQAGEREEKNSRNLLP